MAVLSILIVLLAAGDTAAKAPVTAPGGELSFPVQKYELENGLRVLLQEDHSLPIITLHTFYRVGSRNESTGRTGLAHLIEHMMFNGAARYGPKEFDHIIESFGGYSNAYTDLDITAYHETLFADGLDVVLDMEADRLSSLRFEATTFATENGVVREERRLSSEEDVMGALSELLWSQAYSAHPYRTPVIGWMSDLEHLEPEHARTFFAQHYLPNNCVLVLAGDFDLAAAKTKIAATLGQLKRGDVPPGPTTFEPKQRGERRCILRDSAELPALELAWHVPAVNEVDNAAFLVLSRLLAGSRTARLERELVDGPGVLAEVSIEYTPTLDPGLFIIVARVTTGTSVAKAEAALRALIERLKAEPISPLELERARNLAHMDLVNELAAIESRANVLGTLEVLFRDYGAVFRLVERLAEVDASTLQKLMQAHFGDDNLTVATLLPTDVDAESAPPEASDDSSGGGVGAEDGRR